MEKKEKENQMKEIKQKLEKARQPERTWELMMEYLKGHSLS